MRIVALADLHLGDAVASFADADGRISATLQSGTQVSADMVVLAIGVKPESDLARAAGLDIATYLFGIRSAYMEIAISAVFMDFDAAAEVFDNRDQQQVEIHSFIFGVPAFLLAQVRDFYKYYVDVQEGDAASELADETDLLPDIMKLSKE